MQLTGPEGQAAQTQHNSQGFRSLELLASAVLWMLAAAESVFQAFLPFQTF